MYWSSWQAVEAFSLQLGEGCRDSAVEADSAVRCRVQGV